MEDEALDRELWDSETLLSSCELLIELSRAISILSFLFIWREKASLAFATRVEFGLVGE